MSDTKCPISTLEQRQDVLLGVGASGKLYFFLKNGQYKLTEEEFFACIDSELLLEPKIVFKIQNEAIKRKNIEKPATEEQDFYSKPVEKQDLSLKIEPLMYTAREDTIKQEPSSDLISTNEIFVGGTAILALAISAIQQIKKKKEQLEQQKCCAETKTSLSRLENDVEVLKSKEKESSKALHAEIYEQYKEIKEIKEDSEAVKDILSKVIDRFKN